MTINAAGLDIIKRFEGYRSKVYLCPAGVPTIGYGSTWDEQGNRITMLHREISQLEGDRMLRHECRKVERAVSRLITAELTSNMFSALCSFTFNLGSGNLQSSTLRMKLNRGEYQGVADEFKRWKRAGGRVLKGLVLRRAAERDLFLREDSACCG